jgi:hypothetical protein
MGFTSAGLTNNGKTAHYQISYDETLSQADGIDRANILIAKCEQGFALISSWFGYMRRAFTFLAINGSALTSSPSKHNISTNLRRVIVFALTVASMASMASAQAPYAFKKDPGNNQQIEYTSNIFSPSWSPVPGGLTTNLAPAAITFNGSIFLFAVKPDNSVWLNTLAACAGNWSGWVPFPLGGATDAAVAPVLVGGYLYVIRKGIDQIDQRLYFTWSSNGVNWANWQLWDPGHPITPTFAPTAIVMTNSNSTPRLFVSVRDASGIIQIDNLSLGWSGWSPLGSTDFAPSLTKFASISFTPGNCPPTEFCPIESESDTLYLTVAWESANAPQKRIWVAKTTDGKTWYRWYLVEPTSGEAFPTTPTAPASYGYGSFSGGPGLLVFVNAYGNSERFKESSDPSLAPASWEPWNLSPNGVAPDGAPSDAALAITGAPIPCLR